MLSFALLQDPQEQTNSAKLKQTQSFYGHSYQDGNLGQASKSYSFAYLFLPHPLPLLLHSLPFFLLSDLAPFSLSFLSYIKHLLNLDRNVHLNFFKLTLLKHDLKSMNVIYNFQY